MTSIYDFELPDITGETVSLGDYRGDVLVVVNVASKCGLTPHYAGLQELHANHDDVQVLAFPCNQFGGQEPGSNAEVCEFAQSTYDVTFPMFAKIDVNGPDESPLYTFLKDQQPGDGDSPDITWNFEKFVIDREGNVVARFNPMTDPADLVPVVEELRSA